MPRLIAIYLPQFHPIPENDLWWGKGFTEWTNVGSARPLFRGHYQPRVPADLGYYDLRLPEVREAQASLARNAGVEGFCYYHYWFGDGRQLLERPFNEVLNSGKPDFPFCLCWANHTWTNKTWQQSKAKVKNAILIKQRYLGEDDYTKHFYNVLPAFKDSRYMTVDGKPIFVVYHPLDCNDISNLISIWQKLALINGLKGVFFVGMSPATTSHIVQSDGSVKIVLPNLKSSADVYNRILKLGFDAVNSFGKRRGELLSKGKFNTYASEILSKIGMKGIVKFDYAKTISNFFPPEDKWENVYPTILPQYDRSPRVGKAEGIYVNSTPEKFDKHVKDAINMVIAKNNEHQIIFLDAWNEWAEGCYVEPDLKYGNQYLEVLSNNFNDTI